MIIPSQPAAAEIKKPTEEEQKAYVDKVRQQWVAGARSGDLAEGSLHAHGLTGSVPDVNLEEPYARDDSAGDQQSVFEMKPGEISQPFVDPGASYIYKMVSEKGEAA